MVEIVNKTGGSHRKSGAGVGRPRVDVQRLQEALFGEIDSRTWVAVGTVGFANSDGEFVTNDQESHYSGPDGTFVSVRLEPSDIVITARWGGVGVGRFGRILFPARPGDEVVVVIPDGDPNSDAVSIVAVLGNVTAGIPTDWANDRVLLDLNVPLQVRAPAVDIQSPNLGLNGRKVTFGPEDI